jgi:hypothetical protein
MAMMTAISIDPVRPIAAENAKIPKAQASDSAIIVRRKRVLTGTADSVVWTGMRSLFSCSRAN